MRQKFNPFSRTPNTMSGERQPLLVSWLIPSLQWSMVVATSCFWVLSQQRGQGIGQNWKKDGCIQIQRGPWRTYAPEHSDLTQGTGQLLAWQQHEAKTTLEWPQDMSDCPWVAWRKPCRTSEEGPEDEDGWMVHFPSNLTEPERICQEEGDGLPKSLCTKLLETYHRRLETLTATKCL